MIFDNAQITEYLLKWKSNRNNKRMLAKLVEGSTPLVEAIVSSYDPSHRDDMIQNAYLKLLKAIEHFDPSRGTTLHTYFTTVIHNMCRTTLKSEARYFNLYDIEDYEEMSSDEEQYTEDISAIVEYCRKRFPNIDTNTIDYIVISFVSYVSINGTKHIKDYFQKLHTELGIDVKMLDLIYKVIILLLRYNHIESVLFEVNEEGVISKNGRESFLPELVYMFGEEVANQMSVIFSGMTLRL